MALRDDQVRRYARHVLLPDVGGVGQERLLGAAVRVEVGPCCAGEVVAVIYLAAAGVGTIVLAGDPDGAVTAAEAAAGIAYGPADVGGPRGAVLAGRIAALNQDVRIVFDDADAPGAVPLAVPAASTVAAALIAGGAAACALLHRLAVA